MISIILPTYNEAANIIPLIESIESGVIKDYEIIVADDNSPDKTWELVENYGKKNKNVHVLRRMADHGLTKSIQAGIDAAKGDIVVWLDCDFSHPPEVIPHLIEEVKGGTDMVVASRFVPGGKQKNANPGESQSAILLSTFMNKTLGILFGMNFHDFTSGFIAVKKSVIDTLPLHGEYGEYFINLIVRAKRNSYTITEIPYVSESRRAGESKTAPTFRLLLKRGKKYLQAVIFLFRQ